MKTKVYLCKVFGIDGKLGKYKDIYNNVAILDDKNNLTQLKPPSSLIKLFILIIFLPKNTQLPYLLSLFYFVHTHKDR